MKPAAFDYAITQIKTRNTTLNLLILGEFPKHDEAASKFVRHLKGKTRKQFQDKWQEYKSHYQKLKGINVVFAATSNLLPYKEEPKNEGDILKHAEMEYEYIFNLIHVC